MHALAWVRERAKGGRAYLEDLFSVVGAVYSTRDREDGRRLSSTRWTIEQ